MKFKLFSIILLAIAGFIPGVVFGSTTDGTIDSASRYAWGENIGWLDFGTSQGNVHISDTQLTGYVWGENIGWISLNCSNTSSCSEADYKVANNGNGTLSGYAWSENTGWINFNPANGGVAIDSAGDFSGYAWGENIGWIVFNCSTTNSCGSVSYKTKTDWRPRTSRPACNNTLDDDSDGLADYPNDPGCLSLTDNDEYNAGGGSGGGGGGLPSGYNNPPIAPAGGFRVSINGGAGETSSRNVVLELKGGSDTVKMSISDFSDFRNTGQENYASQKKWLLSEGEGTKNIYVKFFTVYGQGSETVSASIVYKEQAAVSPTPAVVVFASPYVSQPRTDQPGPPITANLPDALQPLIDLFKPKPPKETPAPLEVPIEETLSKTAPLAFQAKWNLMASASLSGFVLAPLPRDIAELAGKFPSLEKTFREVGISKITDLEKLKSVNLNLPGLSERVGLAPGNISGGKFVMPKGVPLANMPVEMKKQIPTEIVFAKGGGELIDYGIALSVNDKGQSEQKISTIAGKTLHLSVVPEKPASAVKGYLVFRSSAAKKTAWQIPIENLLASLISEKPDLAREQVLPVETEEKLVLLEFEYTDSDGDGIYTAEIQAPVVEGEYEIITVIDYDDPSLGKKAIRLVTVVDPEGYVFEKNGGKETRVPGAIVSIFWLNTAAKGYEIWPAKEYQQENPQITDITGKYSFLVPEGSYYIKVEAPGYLEYESKPFQVKDGSGVHMNIEMKTKYWWLKIFDWKAVLLVLVLALVGYNFYRDKKREKILKN